MAKFFLFFLLFNSLYGPRLILMDLMLVFVVLTSLFFIGQSFFSLKLICSKKIMFSFLLLIVFSLFHGLYTNLAEFSLIDIVFKNILYFISASFFVYWYDRFYNKDYYFLFRHLLYATFINGIFVVVSFFYKPFQLFFSNILDYEKQLNWVETGHRIFDISLGGGATASFTFALVFVVGLALPKVERKNLYFLIMSTIAIAASLMGRTGLYFILFYLFFAFLKDIYKIEKISKVILFLAISFILFSYNFEKFNASEYFLWISQGFNGEENATYLAIQNMWFFNYDTLILGDGYFGRIPPNIILSDIGYVRIVHALGVIGLIILYGWLFYLWILSKSSLRNIYIPSVYNLFSILIIMVFLMNFKELHFSSRGTTLILFIVLLLSRKIFHDMKIR